MLLCVATIAAGAISCENKEKKESVENANQEVLMRQEAVKQQEADIKQFINLGYENGYETGFMSGKNKWKYDKEKEYDSDLSSHKVYYLRKSEFLKAHPSCESEYISKYKEGWEDGWREGRKHQ